MLFVKENWLRHIPVNGGDHNILDNMKPYLYHFAYQSGGHLDDFTKLFLQIRNKNLLAQVLEVENMVRIYQAKNGLEGLKLNREITAKEFKQISDEINLTFLPENKDKFSVEEPVHLWLEVKNVSTLHCKVFEFNTLTYYRKTMKPFDTSIDLDGLESTITRKYDFEHVPSICKRKEKFDFPEL